MAADFPLRNHRLAAQAAQVAHCAGDQEMFWEMHDRLLARQRSLVPFAGHAEALGLDVEAFSECVRDGRHAQTVRQMLTEGLRAGVNGTPAFVLGITDADDPGRIRGLRGLAGAQPFSSFKQVIDRALAELDAEAPE